MQDAPVSPLIVIHSGRPADDLRDIARRCNADGFIEKTSSGDDLIQKVKDLLTS